MTSTHEPSLTSHVPELSGHGLRLLPWDADSPADAEAWLRGLTDPEFRRWNTPLRQVEDLAAARASLRAKAERAADGADVTFRVVDAVSGTTLGQIGVNMIDRLMSTARVGYWVLPEARGRGVATRALLLAGHWALTSLGLHRLELGHAVGHDVSCRTAERCGFPAEGTLRGAMWEDERRSAYRDVHLHARLATDPEVTATAAP
ncbi:GNAT family N-acetyltransferase [Streptomyces sp. NPDC058739]|uniref:GNAT family N-acetyltransferase n=1 Tax=Streptomyces sp. NPDC058739 TaxID=3346618 RepID=UPI0036B608E7